LEVGSGSNDLLDGLGGPFTGACDLSLDMLHMPSSSQRSQCVVAPSEALPLRNAQFDGLFFIYELISELGFVRIATMCYDFVYPSIPR
jgi:hypothetical protein